jgi:hypothetical protein
VTVVADGHADPSGGRIVDGRAGVARGVVALLVKVFVLGDVHHARPTEQRAVGVEDGRGVERAVSIALHQVEDDDHSPVGGGLGEGLRRGARHRLGEIEGALVSLRDGHPRVERRERELGEDDEISPSVGGRPHRPCAAIDRGRGRRRVGVLDEGDVHGSGQY